MSTHITDQTDWIFGSINKEVLDKFTLVSFGDYLPSNYCAKSGCLIISISIGIKGGSMLLDILLNKYNLRNRNHEVYLREKCISNYDICTAISEHIKELHL